MRQGHFAMIFFVIYMACFLWILGEQNRYDNVLQEKKRIETALLQAAETAGEELVAAVYDSEEKRKSIAETAFLESLYLSLGMLESQEERQHLKMYLPMLILVEEDGAYFYYMQEVFKQDISPLKHGWSEKILFAFGDEETEEEKKKIIVETLEKRASEIITEHNYIALQYGVSYSFSVPSFMQNIKQITQLPALLAVFQGWPLSPSKDIVYENCIDSGVYLQEKEKFLVEIPKDLQRTKCIYHRAWCTEIKKNEERMVEDYVTKYEAIYQYGAYSCEKCSP